MFQIRTLHNMCDEPIIQCIMANIGLVTTLKLGQFHSFYIACIPHMGTWTIISWTYYGF